MKIIIRSGRGGSYTVFLHDGRHVTATGLLDLTRTSKGVRPKDFRVRSVGRRQYRHLPTREFIALLRKSEIYLSSPDEAFESFLSDLQIGHKHLNACRICLAAERITPLKKKNAVRYGKEEICLDCAKKELRREIGYIGGMGTLSTGHLDHLLELYRDLDRVLGMVQPAQAKRTETLFDRLEAHPVTATQALKELPLPDEFVARSGVERLMPVQQLSVNAGLLDKKDLLIVAATASGKTFIGEMAGLKNQMEGRGAMLFLVPLVALANQKYMRFSERYSGICKVALQTGVSRLNLPETRLKASRDLNAPVVVGTYEGIDNAIRRGRKLGPIGTVVIDEVQMLEDRERGHRLDGLIARLKYLAPEAQFLYLSATIGSPSLLAEKLNASLVRYDDRPVPLERHLIFLERKEKPSTIKKLVAEEFKMTSSKGYRGQTIVFSNARARCHVLAETIGKNAAPYHAGLSAQEKRVVEEKFAKGDLAAVVTTAALAAGVDFPASQVIFDSLAMGIEWLTVQEFTQMMGRAGRPDFHDLGRVVVLASPGASYGKSRGVTEEEIAIRLLKGDMEEVSPVYGEEESSEEYVANALLCRGNHEELSFLCNTMVGEMEDVAPALMNEGLIREGKGKIVLSPLARVMAIHFIGISRLGRIRDLIAQKVDPFEIVAELECSEEEEEKVPKKEKQKTKKKGRSRSRG